MSDFKYIVMRTTVGGCTRDIPIIFPDILVHALVANALIEMKEGQLARATIVSAGSLQMSDVEAFGRSTSLKVISREEDSNLINTYPYTHGIV